MLFSTTHVPAVWAGRHLSCRAFRRRWASKLSMNRARDRFSILTNQAVSKQSVLDRVALRDKAPPGSPSPNASAILVSKDLSRWLDDTDFMSALLQQLHPNAGGSDQELSVLTAAVDGLCPRSPRGPPSSGLSILQGDAATILPGLWDREAPTASLRQLNEDARPALSVRLSPFLGDFRPVDVTLPLANTVFENARPFTLLASRWRAGGAGASSTGALTLVDAFEKETQRIAAATEQSIQSHADVSTPLFPLTPPRKIIAGLGNIVREVEAHGSMDGEENARPASEELETSMHDIIAKRSRRLPGIPVPNRTWALVVPPNSACLDFLVKFFGCMVSFKSEHEAADGFARNFSKVLADGGRLHRVLSGGGGWGAKRGLLSLDPETRYSSSGAQDLESFIASFGGEATADGLATPGSYVQFLVEPMPLLSPGSTNQAGGRLPSLVLGTTPAQIEGDEKAEPTPSSAWLAAGHFGALSSNGIFLSLESGAGSEAARGSRPHTTLTKVDVPNAYVWQGMSRWI
ncbi:hypothetical protein MAPG_01133 [Magnaporthiopsis poae ATCC 64411]|uniref:Uncharacterized protein n=1 Tax=Magnaporthiopsis poae (strain ATCC 64411 / 73-15) TaxID=644358 RepID=A0A0C4DMW8_MAGP6|nr:hypothetical protein MAPG_01133 [Magnaporthiopsis poae ATCC 64411]